MSEWKESERESHLLAAAGGWQIEHVARCRCDSLAAMRFVLLDRELGATRDSLQTMLICGWREQNVIHPARISPA